MGIGKSLKKFVKKAAPVVGMVAPFIPGVGPIAGAAIGALGQVAGGGGVKEALLGGLGGYAAGGFGQGVQQAGGWGKLLSQPGGGIGSLLKAGFGGIRSTPLGQGIGGIFNKFTGGAQIAGGGGAQAATKSPGIMEQTYGAASQAAGGGGRQPGLFTGEGTGSLKDYISAGSSRQPGLFTGEGAGNAIDQAVQESLVTYNDATDGQGSTGGFMDFVKNAFNEKNLPLTSGILGGLAQMWENKQNEGAGDVTLGEGLDYYTDGRGVLTGLANGGRIGFADGDAVRDAEYEGWKQMYEKNPEVAMMMHGNSAEYLEKYNKEMELNSKAKGGIIGLANGGEPTMEMDYRGGGFIPVGAKERADDVPARLSKNEFVMTADAVRAAGGGSIEKGSQRMYDLMNSLEARA